MAKMIVITDEQHLLLISCVRGSINTVELQREAAQRALPMHDEILESLEALDERLRQTFMACGEELLDYVPRREVDDRQQRDEPQVNDGIGEPGLIEQALPTLTREQVRELSLEAASSGKSIQQLAIARGWL